MKKMMLIRLLIKLKIEIDNIPVWNFQKHRFLDKLIHFSNPLRNRGKHNYEKMSDTEPTRAPFPGLSRKTKRNQANDLGSWRPGTRVQDKVAEQRLEQTEIIGN